MADKFRFRGPSTPSDLFATKRHVLATIARLFDPIGWLGPTIIVAKMLHQELWKLNLEWDNELPQSIIGRWTTFQGSLSMICEIKIPRWLGTCSNERYYFHGFADASLQVHGY